MLGYLQDAPLHAARLANYNSSSVPAQASEAKLQLGGALSRAFNAPKRARSVHASNPANAQELRYFSPAACLDVAHAMRPCRCPPSAALTHHYRCLPQRSHWIDGACAMVCWTEEHCRALPPNCQLAVRPACWLPTLLSAQGKCLDLTRSAPATETHWNCSYNSLSSSLWKPCGEALRARRRG